MVSLPEPILRHSVGVAEFMANYAKKHPELHADPYEYYIVGLLHDIGKLYPGDPDTNGKNQYKNHAAKGGALLEKMGFCYAEAVKHHGHPEDWHRSDTWYILNLADLSVNSKGEAVDIRSRVKNIGERYGKNSKEFHNAKTLLELLRKEGYVKDTLDNF